MGRDKARDDKLFNCSQSHEINYVASLYPGNEGEVRELLQKLCLKGEIKNFTHLEVYRLIQEKLGFKIPLVKLKPRTLDKPKPKK